MMLGSAIEDGAEAVDAYVMPQGLTVTGNKVTLPQTPKEGETPTLTKVSGESISTTFTGKESGSLTGVKDGDIVYVSGYAYVAPADNMKIAIKSDKFAGSYKMILDEQVFNADMQIIARKQTVFHKVIPNDSFTLDGSAERAEKTASYTFTVALEPGQADLGYVLYVPEGAAK